MTLRIDDVTVDRTPGLPVTAQIPVYSSAPGTLRLTYPPGVTGPAEVVIPGVTAAVGPGGTVPHDVWTVRLFVYSPEEGAELPVTYSDNVTGPATVTIVDGTATLDVTIHERGEHWVEVASDRCGFMSGYPAEKVLDFFPLWQQFDPPANIASATSPLTSGGCGEYAFIDESGDELSYTLAVRYKPEQNAASVSTTFLLNVAHNPNMSTHSHVGMQDSVEGRRPGFIFRNKQNTLTKQVLIGTPYLNFGTWYNVVFSYSYTISAQTGVLLCYIDGVLHTTHSLGANDQMGYIYDREAQSACNTVTFLPATSSRVSFYDFYLSNNYAWTLADAQKFHANDPTDPVDPDHYTIHWPMVKRTDAPGFVDIDIKNGIPLYIPGPSPEIGWIDKP